MLGKLKGLTKNTQSALAAITLIAGFAMMWSSVASGAKDRDARSIVLDRTIDIDPLLPDHAHNGRHVVASGMLQSPESLGDEFLKPGPYLILVRNVEMFQWSERVAKGAGANEYVLGWSSRPIDFMEFAVRAGHENPLFRIKEATQKANQTTFGAFKAEKILDRITTIPPLELTKEMLVDPSLSIEDNKILVPVDKASSVRQAGDVRVWYSAVPRGEYTIMTRQVDEMTLVGAKAGAPVTIMPGRKSAAELLGDLKEESEEAYANLLYIGGGLFFFGLFSVLIPFAPSFDLRPKLQAQGVLAVLLVSGAITLALMLIFLVLSLFS